MTSGKQSKAQRRTDNQRRAEEKRRAELRRKRTRIGIRVGGVLAVVAIAVVIIVQVGGGNGSVPPRFTDPHVPTEAIPSSMSSSWVQPPAGTKGPEGIPVPTGPKLATLLNAATGQSIDGVQCEAGEQVAIHVHTHLTIFVNGQARVIPYGIGIPGFQPTQTPQGPFVSSGSCFYWLHVHAYDGIVHVEAPSTAQGFTLGQFFDEWGIPLSTTQVGSATGKVTVFFASPGHQAALYTGDPRNLPLGKYYQIQLDVGTPIVAPVKLTTWGQL